MPRRARPLALLLGAAIAIAGCQALPPINVADGVLVDGWVFPTAAPLPPGAVRLPLAVATPPQDVPADVEMGACPAALMAPVTLTVDRSTDPPTLHFIGSDGGEVKLTWSYGISAWEIDGVAEVVLPDGEIIVREGELSRIDLGGGGAGPNGDTFGVCITAPHRA